MIIFITKADIVSIPKVKLNNGSSIANALNGNDISLGFDEIRYEESSISGWYMGIENPQYTIYARSQVNPVQPNIWATSGTSDVEILNFINRTTNVGNVPFTSTTEAFYYTGTKAENFIIKGSYPDITLQDLVLNYDTGSLMGYPWSGNTVYDLSPTQSHTTLSGSPTFSASYDGILDFDGSGQFGSGPDLGQLTAFTVNTWFRLESIPNSSEAPAIVTEKFAANNLGWVIGFIDSPQNGDIAGGFFNNQWYKTASFTPVLNTWYNVTLSYDNATLSLYIDGVLFDSVSVSVPAISSGLGYNVGKRWDGNDYIDGQIQVVQIYNKCLNSGEISNGYNEFVTRFSSPSVTPTPTPTNTPTSTSTQTPTPTNSGTPTPTPTPTETSIDSLINPIITEQDEYIDTGSNTYLMFAEPIGVTPTPTPTNTSTPTPTPTNTPTVTTTTTETTTPTPTNTPTETLGTTPTPTATVTTTNTETPTPTPTTTETSTPTPTITPSVTESPTPTNTPTPTETPTNTPTPSVTPQAVTGYSFNLVQLPYNFPTSGNSIINQGAIQSGDTNPNILTTSGRGFYFNSIDSNGTDRTNYFSGFTGQSVTITLTQTGSTAIYSGDSESFKVWSASTIGSGFVFGTGVGVPPINTPSGNAVLIQSANTEWNFGIPVYVSLTINGLVTSTPTPTNTSTPTQTPSPTTTVTPTNTETPTVTPTQTNTPSPSVTETPTPTPTNTVTPTNTETPTVTPTQTNTPSPSVTETPTPTPTNTVTPSITQSPTETPTLTPTNTSTPTPTSTELPISTFNVTMLEVGPNVVMSGSGTFNLSGLVKSRVNENWTGGYNATNATWYVANYDLPATTYDFYSGSTFTTFPNSFGSGSGQPDAFSGNGFAVDLANGRRWLGIQTGYTSGQFISGYNTYNNKTLSSMGLTPGTYTYSWGSGSITLQIGPTSSTPTPTPTNTSTPTNTPTPSVTETPTNTPTPTPAPVSSNLVLYYDPSNPSSYSGSGTTINDLSGNGLNGSMSNITFATPFFTYNGSTSQVTRLDNVLLEPGSGDWTMEVWVNQTNASGSQVILGKFDPGGGAQDVSYSIRIIGGNVRADYGNGSSAVSTTDYATTVGTTYQLVYVFNNVANNNIITYVNGVQQYTNTHSFANLLNTSANLYLGSYNGGEYSQYFNGKIGITRLYSSALTSAQVLQNFNANKSKYGL